MKDHKKVLVTGATGFIGANLARRLISLGFNVNLILRARSNPWRIKDILSKVKIYEGDLRDQKTLNKLVNKIKPQIIYHLATYGSYPSFQKDLQQMIQTNIVGTANLLNTCSKVGFDLFVNTGTSSEYGIKNAPISETDLLEPNNDYGVTKATATLLCQSIAKRNNLPIATLRFFSAYGYYEEPFRLIPTVIRACLKNERLLLSSPNSVRDFCFVEDIVDAYLTVASVKNISGEIFNVSVGKQYTVGAVVDKIIELSQAKMKPEWDKMPKHQNEPKSWVADISKAEKFFKWKPKYSLNEGLKKTITWFQQNLHLYNSVRQ